MAKRGLDDLGGVFDHELLVEGAELGDDGDEDGVVGGLAVGVLEHVLERDVVLADAAERVLEELAEELRLNRADPAAARDSLLQTMACKSAIKAGMWSDPSELQALADKVQSGEIRYCPHGRPVAVKLSKYEMEKMFKRA